jgi:tRNA threonylcarbamoyl adenosine modification protein YjeE
MTSINRALAEDETIELLWSWLEQDRGQRDAPVFWIFRGPMGAGKSTYIRKLLHQMGYSNVFGSPTYLREIYYKGTGTLRDAIHADWYRLENEQELMNFDWEERLLSADTHCFVEWPERAPQFIERLQAQTSLPWKFRDVTLAVDEADASKRRLSSSSR